MIIKKSEDFFAGRPLMRDILLVFILALFGVISAVIIYKPWNSLTLKTVSHIYVDNHKISVGEEGVAELNRLARLKLQKSITFKNSGINYKTTFEKMGAVAKLSSLKRIIMDLGMENSPAENFAILKGKDLSKIKFTIPLSFDSDMAVEALVAIKEKLDLEPSDARFDFNNSAVKPEIFGRSLDVYGTIISMEKAAKNGDTNVALVVNSVKPEIVASSLNNIDVDTVAGFFETPYSRMSKDRDRTHNVKLGASMLDGHVILPGELFSFNRVVGDRSQARGFRYAPVIAGGKVVEGMGGGTCQVASTLYAAAFFAGLVIEDRVPHSRPSSYIKLGLDATVSYPNKDLKLRNPLNYPVVIHFSVIDGIARVEIRAKERPFTVSLLRKTIDEIQYPVKTVDDPLVAKGTELITQRGVPGYKVQRLRVIERNKVAYRFQSFDRYPPTTQFVHKGTGDPVSIKNSGKKLPHADMHKPYRASNSLRLVQGAGVWYEKTHN
ncbi:MAG: VanW family protein [Deltaproteobacteria bacterium]|nr:VanW family protein [Deltaproteobacteria bacterium]